jgi:hypothetical protein
LRHRQRQQRQHRGRQQRRGHVDQRPGFPPLLSGGGQRAAQQQGQQTRPQQQHPDREYRELDRVLLGGQHRDQYRQGEALEGEQPDHRGQLTPPQHEHRGQQYRARGQAE